MNVLNKAVLAVVVSSVFAVSAQAAVQVQQSSPSMYVGAKVGKFMLDEDFKDPMAYGVIAGYNFNDNVGVEAEYIGSDTKTTKVGAFDVDYSAKTYGIYGTYKYDFNNTNIYAKGKLGLAKVEAKAEAKAAGQTGSGKASDSGIAGGLGLGYKVNPNIAIEGEYAIVASDVDALTIGATYKF